MTIIINSADYIIIQLPLPKFVTERRYHSVSAIQLSPHSVLLIIFGGQNHWILLSYPTLSSLN